jgi:hypothetical protein
MIAACWPLSRSAAEEMPQVMGRRIRDRPGEDRAQRRSHSNEAVHATLGFERRHGQEYLLPGMVSGHLNLIPDKMYDYFPGIIFSWAARTR